MTFTVVVMSIISSASRIDWPVVGASMPTSWPRNPPPP